MFVSGNVKHNVLPREPYLFYTQKFKEKVFAQHLSLVVRALYASLFLLLDCYLEN